MGALPQANKRSRPPILSWMGLRTYLSQNVSLVTMPLCNEKNRDTSEDSDERVEKMKDKKSNLLPDIAHFGVDGGLQKPLLDRRVSDSGLDGAVQALKYARHRDEKRWTEGKDIVRKPMQVSSVKTDGWTTTQSVLLQCSNIANSTRKFQKNALLSSKYSCWTTRRRTSRHQKVQKTSAVANAHSSAKGSNGKSHTKKSMASTESHIYLPPKRHKQPVLFFKTCALSHSFYEKFEWSEIRNKISQKIDIELSTNSIFSKKFNWPIIPDCWWDLKLSWSFVGIQWRGTKQIRQSCTIWIINRKNQIANKTHHNDLFENVSQRKVREVIISRPDVLKEKKALNTGPTSACVNDEQWVFQYRGPKASTPTSGIKINHQDLLVQLTHIANESTS